MGLFDRIGAGTVDEAHKAATDVISRIDPILTHIFMMARTLLHGVIDRFDIKVHFEIKPDRGPNPPPD